RWPRFSSCRAFTRSSRRARCNRRRSIPTTRRARTINLFPTNDDAESKDIQFFLSGRPTGGGCEASWRFAADELVGIAGGRSSGDAWSGRCRSGEKPARTSRSGVAGAPPSKKASARPAAWLRLDVFGEQAIPRSGLGYQDDGVVVVWMV